jgi:hypothetical protein
VFVNLLGNAVGHNPPGTRVTMTAWADGPGSVSITVADDGPGMPAEIAAAPFEPRRARRAKSAGAGLGLSIARGIVIAHGGQIELSPWVSGTTFVVRLPVEDGAVPAAGSGLGTGPPVGAAADTMTEPMSSGPARGGSRWPERQAGKPRLARGAVWSA